MQEILLAFAICRAFLRTQVAMRCFEKTDENSLISAAQSLISALALFGLMHDFMNFIIPRRRPELAFLLRGLASSA